MSIELRQSTAGQEVLLGPFLDTTDADSEETGLTIANTDIKIWKCGAETSVDKNSGGATHKHDGMYLITLDATDTNTVGSGLITVHVAGALYVKQPFIVRTAAVYDALVAGTGYLSVNLVADQSAATVGTVTTVTSAGLSAAAVDAIWDEAVTAHTTANTSGERLNEIDDMLTGKMAISGVTMTHYKQDGTSVRKAFTLDSTSAPTSRTPT